MNSFTTKPSIEKFFTVQAQEWGTRYESRTYRRRRELVRQIVMQELHRLGATREASEVLDFGCGGGVLLKDLVELGVRVTGVDTSRAMIDKARSQFRPDDPRIKVEWLQNGSGEGEYEARSYDIVVCTSVLEFIPEIDPVLARLCSTIRPGGILLVSAPNRRSWLRKIEQFIHRHPHPFRLLPRFDHLVGPDSYLNYQRQQLTIDELTQVLEGCGLCREEHRFHVAPKVLGSLERLEMMGMMLMAVFRK